MPLADLLEKIQKKLKDQQNQDPSSMKSSCDELSYTECEHCGVCFPYDPLSYRPAICDRCVATRMAQRIIEDSGLEDALAELTFDKFIASSDWQKHMLSVAQGFAEHVKAGGRNWFFLGGQAGCGKTHICTAICGELLYAGIPVKYMMWTEEIRRIKAGINDEDTLDELLEPLMRVKVLYIDDLFKCQRNNEESRPQPSPADVKLAFDILNARYVRNLTTIISCEWSLASLIEVDEGTFSRVYQRCKPFSAYIKMDPKKNYRLKDGAMAGYERLD